MRALLIVTAFWAIAGQPVSAAACAQSVKTGKVEMRSPFVNRLVRVRLVNGKIENGTLRERENDLFYTVPQKMRNYRIYMSLCFTPDEVDAVTDLTDTEGSS